MKPADRDAILVSLARAAERLATNGLTVTIVPMGVNTGGGASTLETILKQLQAILTLLQQQGTTMSAQFDAFSAALATLSDHIDAAATRVNTDVAALNQKITDLKAQIDAGGMTADESAQALAKLAELEAKVDSEVDPTLPPATP